MYTSSWRQQLSITDHKRRNKLPAIVATCNSYTRGQCCAIQLVLPTPWGSQEWGKSPMTSSPRLIGAAGTNTWALFAYTQQQRQTITHPQAPKYATYSEVSLHDNLIIGANTRHVTFQSSQYYILPKPSSLRVCIFKTTQLTVSSQCLPTYAHSHMNVKECNNSMIKHAQHGIPVRLNWQPK